MKLFILHRKKILATAPHAAVDSSINKLPNIGTSNMLPKCFKHQSILPLILTVFLVLGVGNVWGQISMSSTSSHTQNFNGLATSGTSNTWTDNSTISNWYSQRTGSGTTYSADAGSGTAGTLYSYGTGTNSDRALGTIGSGNAAAGSFAHGVLLRNTSGSTITDIKVSYTLEQWRKSGVTAAQSITFYFKTSSTTFTALNPNSNSTWTEVPGLTLSSPINTSTAAALDGNAAANKVSLSNVSIPSLSLANNDYIMLKWEDPDHTGTDHGLAIDDVTISWSVAASSISWDGNAWSNGTGPTSTDNTTIGGNYITSTDLNTNDLTINAGVTLTISPTHTLTVSGDLVNNGSIVFKSDNTGTARFGVYGGASISGTNTTVERYLPAKRAWRLLTAPLTNATNATIQTHWQNTGTGTGLLLWNPNQETGMQTGQGIANIYRFGSPAAGWNAITNTTTEPLFGNGVNHAFLVFATAPANETNVTAAAQATTLRPTGNLRVGDVAHANLPANTYRLLGNPYASALDIGLLKSQNPGAFGNFWLLDPNLGEFGGYVTYNGTAFAPSTNSNPAHTYSTNNTRIESGQAFFVRPSAVATFTFTESQKATNVAYSMAKPATISTNSFTGIRANLYKTVNQNPIITDGILAIFDVNETNEVNENDSRKFTNNNENIMFRNNNISLSIENRALPLSQEELLMRLTNTVANQNYQLRLFTENYTNTMAQPYLQDAFNQQLTLIPTDGTELIYPFNGITSSNATPDERFKIVFQNSPLGVSNNSLGSIAIYPNPVNEEYFDIHLPYLVNETLSYELYNVHGQLIIPVNHLTPGVISHRIQTKGLAKGVYLLKVKGSNQDWSQKIIVN